MKLEKFRYRGPLSAVKLVYGVRSLEVPLVPGMVIDLPPEHDYVRALRELGHLNPVPPAPEAVPAPKAKPKKGAKPHDR